MKPLLILAACLPLALSAIISPPQNGTYRNGVDLSATLRCEVDTDVTVYWIHKNKVILLSSKYLIASPSTGNYSLTIKDLGRSDTGMYNCQQGESSVEIHITVGGKETVCTQLVWHGVSPCGFSFANGYLVLTRHADCTGAASLYLLYRK